MFTVFVWLVKVVTKSSLKTKKTKTKVTIQSLFPSSKSSFLLKTGRSLLPVLLHCAIHSINGSLIHSFSFTPKSRFTAHSTWNILILFTSKIVSKTVTNVYMTLEVCPSGSFMDMLRRRRRFGEPEARFYIFYWCMHTRQVIHSDLKLGNLFLDSNMNVRVGDF